MNDRWSTQKTNFSINSILNTIEPAVRLVTGIVLILISCALTYWLITSLYLLWDTPEDVGMIRFFERLSAGDNVLVLPAGIVEFPHAWTIVIGVFFCILLMSIVATLVTALFREAFRILFPSQREATSDS
ncbi:MAG TPA: hypothetical protein ENJ32_07020 [Crenotrichaceae bacterium]|nr:hypothetical protein [Crenotrichaceae bacterium]